MRDVGWCWETGRFGEGGRVVPKVFESVQIDLSVFPASKVGRW